MPLPKSLRSELLNIYLANLTDSPEFKSDLALIIRTWKAVDTIRAITAGIHVGDASYKAGIELGDCLARLRSRFEQLRREFPIFDKILRDHIPAPIDTAAAAAEAISKERTLGGYKNAAKKEKP